MALSATAWPNLNTLEVMQALGIIAFELLTGTRVFPPFNNCREEIAETLLGDHLLPWEQESAERDLLPRLRALKRSVLACLERDPNQRPTSAEVLGKWHSLLETETAKASRKSTLRASSSSAELPTVQAQSASTPAAAREAGRPRQAPQSDAIMQHAQHADQHVQMHEFSAAEDSAKSEQATTLGHQTHN